MTAQIIYLADYRASRAWTALLHTLNPLTWWAAWWRFLMGGRA